MKQLKLRSGMAVLLGATMMWTSCQKEVSSLLPLNQTTQTTSARLGGLVADDPNTVSLVPMIMSSGTSGSPSGFKIADISATLKGKHPAGGTTDATPPAVSITSPSNGTAVTGTVSVAVTASDNVGVASVSLSVDGTVKTTLTTAPYNFPWDASVATDGTHTLMATAKDAKGNAASYTITVSKNTVIVTPPPVTLPASALLVTPPIGDQGYQELTCTPYSSVYAARSIEQYYRTGASSYSSATNIFSVKYVYNQTKISADCNSGTSITLTLDLMKNKGVCTSQTMPYVDGDCATMPTAAQDAEAANYKIGAYSKMLNTDLTAIKTMIYQNHPVIFSAVMDNSFTNAGPGFIWSSYSGSGALPHCMIICGYDDTKNAFKVMNSWGTTWGDAGYSWITYDFFPVKTGYYVYAMNY